MLNGNPTRRSALAILAGALWTPDRTASAQPLVRQGFDMETPVAPSPVRIGGVWSLVYEALGSFASIDAFARGEPWTRSPKSPRDGSDMPGPQAVVRFIG